MSRYEIRGREPYTAIVIGWDRPLSTYFAQVWDERVDDEEEALLLWGGCYTREIPSVEKLADALKPFVTLTPEMRAQLERDRAADQGRPAPLRT